MYIFYDDRFFLVEEEKKEPVKNSKRDNRVKNSKNSNTYSTYENNIQYSYTGNTMVHTLYSSSLSSNESMIK